MNTEYPTAPLIKRLMSTLYDSLILAAISFTYFLCATWVSHSFYQELSSDYQPNATGWLIQSGWFLTLITFYCFFWLRIGQTVAMKTWRLKLISDNGALNYRRCITRAILGFFALACAGLGYLWIVIDKDGLALHDRLTKTRVVVLPKDIA